MRKAGLVPVALTVYHAVHAWLVPGVEVQVVPLPYPPLLHVDGEEAFRPTELVGFGSARGPSYVLTVEPAQLSVRGFAPTLRFAA